MVNCKCAYDALVYLGDNNIYKKTHLALWLENSFYVLWECPHMISAFVLHEDKSIQEVRLIFH